MVPKFSGELRHWHSFWNGFQQAVHNAADLSKPAKLSYLREAMKDEDLYEMLNRFSNDEGCYDQAVQELQDMFDKPRQMHQIYLSNLTTMGPVKCTQKALTTYANTLVQSRDGLVRLRQYDGKYILTSLVVGFLPDKVRMAWEDATDDSKTVPTVDELIAFVRKKAANPPGMRCPALPLTGGLQGSRASPRVLLMWLYLSSQLLHQRCSRATTHLQATGDPATGLGAPCTLPADTTAPSAVRLTIQLLVLYSGK